MSDARDGFDAIGAVVDWIDACKQRRLYDLLNLYDAAATVECCEGGSFKRPIRDGEVLASEVGESGDRCFRDRCAVPRCGWRDIGLSRLRRRAGADAFLLHRHGEDKPHRLCTDQSGRLKAAGAPLRSRRPVTILGHPFGAR